MSEYVNKAFKSFLEPAALDTSFTSTVILLLPFLIAFSEQHSVRRNSACMPFCRRGSEYGSINSVAHTFL